jgi:hypothetical protein
VPDTAIGADREGIALPLRRTSRVFAIRYGQPVYLDVVASKSRT